MRHGGLVAGKCAMSIDGAELYVCAPERIPLAVIGATCQRPRTRHVSGTSLVPAMSKCRGCQKHLRVRPSLSRCLLWCSAVLCFACRNEGSRQDLPITVGSIDLEIGTSGDDDNQFLFSDVRGLAVDSDGRIIVAEYAANEVRVFSSNGDYRYSFGRSGTGPGDLRGPCCISFDRNGTLWVQESANLRYSAFRLGPSRAEFQRTIRRPSTAVVELPRITWDQQGHLVHVTSQTDPTGGRLVTTLAHLDSSGAIVERDTLVGPPTDSVSEFVTARADGSGVAQARYRMPFGAQYLFAIADSGELAQAVSSNSVVVWYGPDHVRRSAVVPQGDVPLVSANERDHALTALRRIERATGRSVPFEIPGHKPQLVALGFDLRGRLWIQRSVAEGKPPAAYVFNWSGKPATKVSWPQSVDMSLFVAFGDTALAVSSDTLGVLRVVRLVFR